MFADCPNLTEVDLRGVGTAYVDLAGDVDTGAGGMTDMFEGCEKLISATGEQADQNLSSRIVIGEATSVIANGFFGENSGRTVEEGDDKGAPVFDYVLAASVYVFGGPTEGASVALCPGAKATEVGSWPVHFHSENVYLMDSSALSFQNSVWTARLYRGVRNESGISSNTYASGFIGLGSTDAPVTIDGITYNGRSVEWILQGDVDAHAGTLIIRPYENSDTPPVLRRFNPASDAAPWGPGSAIEGQFSSVVVETAKGCANIADGTRITTSGDLMAMFYGCTSVTSIDLTELHITEDVTDTSDMFRSCPLITDVVASSVETAAMSDAERAGHVILPEDGDYASIKDASGMFADMPRLASADLTGFESPFAAVKSANLSSMFEGSFTTDDAGDPTARGRLALRALGQGAGADLTGLARQVSGEASATTGLVSLALEDVGTGAGAKLTSAFAGNRALAQVDASTSASGVGADLTGAFSDCAKDVSGTSEVRYALTDTGLNEGAIWTRAFQGAFTGEADALKGSSVAITASPDATRGPVASLASLFGHAGELTGDGADKTSERCHIALVDLTGFAGCAGSAERLAFGADKITRVMRGVATPGALVFSDSFSFGEVTNLAEAFAAMPALEQVTLSGLSAEGSGELTLERAFADDPALATVTLPASNWEGNDLYEPVCDPRQISSMRYMFEGDSSLKTLDITGLNTASPSLGTTDEENVISSGMDGMFKGCTSLTKSFGQSHDEERGAQITIGPVTSKLLNGFFWWRSSVNANPDYILDADIRMRAGRSASGDVALAGPASATDLMLRPDHAGTYYDATVAIDATNMPRRGIWLERRYLNVSIDGTPIDPGEGALVDWGLIGEKAAHLRPDGTEVAADATGGSVAWSIHDAPTGEGGVMRTLYIFPTEPGDTGWGKMRSLVSGAFAPWTRVAGSEHYRTLERAVVSPGVRAGSSLEAMFNGCEALASIDLRALQVSSATTNMTGMFQGCASVTRVIQAGTHDPVDTQGAIVLYPASAEVASSLQGSFFDTSGVSLATRLFADMTRLHEVRLQGGVDADGHLTPATSLFPKPGVILSYMFEGSFATASAEGPNSVTLASVAQGAGADVSRLFSATSKGRAPAYLERISLSDVGSGASAKLTYLASGLPRLTSATLHRVGNGAAADLTGAFAGVLSEDGALTDSLDVSLTFTDVGCGGTLEGNGATLTSFFEGAFVSTDVDPEKSSVRFAFEGASDTDRISEHTVSSLSRFCWASDDGRRSRLGRLDLRQMPAVFGEGRMDRAFAGMGEIEQITNVYAGDASSDIPARYVVLPTGWDTSSVTSMAYLCADMASLEYVETQDLVMSSAGTSFAYAFASSPRLTACVLDVSGGGAFTFDERSVENSSISPGTRTGTRPVEVRPGRASDMRGMFAGCERLRYLDLYGLGTALPGASDSYGTSSGMANMFEGCAAMVRAGDTPETPDSTDSRLAKFASEPSTRRTAEQMALKQGEPPAGANAASYARSARPEIVVGPASDQLLVGFFGQSDAEGGPYSYISCANIDVYSGPQASSALELCPQVAGETPAYSYKAFVNLANTRAVDAVGAWAHQRYMNTKMMGTSSATTEAGDTALASGYVGLEGRYGGVDQDGSSVKWSIVENGSSKVLRIQPNFGDEGIMRAFGTDRAIAAPWSSLGEYGRYAPQIDRVEVSGTIICTGSLASAFQGLTRASVMDLRALKIIDEDPLVETGSAIKNPAIPVRSVSSMLAGCESIERVVMQGRTDAQGRPTSVGYGTCALPSEMESTSLVSADQMLAGCTSLAEVDLAGLGRAASMSMAELTRGCTSLANLRLTDVATGPRSSIASAFADLPALTDVTLSRVGGERLDATGAFAGCIRLARISASNLGSTDADLTRAFARIATAPSGLDAPEIVLTDTGCATGCILDEIFQGSFTTSASEPGRVEMATTLATKSAVLSAKGMFAATDLDHPTRLGQIDLTGLGGVARKGSGATATGGSAAYAFYGCAAMTYVGYKAEPGSVGRITLAGDATWKNATDLSYLFAGCTRLETAEIGGIAQSSAGVSLASMFEGCASLRRALLSANIQVYATTAAQATQRATQIGSATDMRSMFAGCAALTEIDLTGVGSSQIPGSVNQWGTAESGMKDMFEGCTAMLYDPEDPEMRTFEQAKANDDTDKLDELEETSKITIGPAFTKVLNGFFASRTLADVRPDYLITSNVYVYGGPYAPGRTGEDAQASALMERPNVGGYNYYGEVSLVDPAAIERNKLGASAGLELWTYRGYFSTPVPSVSLTFQTGSVVYDADGVTPVGANTGWQDANGYDLTVSPAAQTRSLKSAKFEVKYEGDGAQRKWWAQLKKTGKSVADEQMISSLTMPSAYGYIAARYPSKTTPQVLTAAQSIEDVGWYFARGGSFAYRDQSGTPVLYTWQAGERTTNLQKAEGYMEGDKVIYDRPYATDLFYENIFGPLPLFDRTGKPVTVTGEDGKEVQQYATPPAFNLFCQATEITYPVQFQDTGVAKKRVFNWSGNRNVTTPGGFGNHGELNFSSQSSGRTSYLRLPSPDNLNTDALGNASGTPVDWTAEHAGEEFLGWTLTETPTSPDDWVSATYKMPGQIAGAAPPGEESATGGAMAGYKTTVTLYAQWAEVPKVTYKVNSSDTWRAYVAKDGQWAEPKPDLDLIGEGSAWAYYVQGADVLSGASTELPVLRGGKVAGVAVNNADPQEVTHSAVTAKARRVATPGAKAGWGHVETFVVDVPNVYVEGTQSDSGWAIDVAASIAPEGLLSQNRTWDVRKSMTLYRVIGPARYILNYAPGFAGDENAAPSEVDDTEAGYTLASASRIFPYRGYSFRTWSGTWARSAVGVEITYADASVNEAHAFKGDVRAGERFELHDMAHLNQAAIEALFPAAAEGDKEKPSNTITASWDVVTYTATFNLNGGSSPGVDGSVHTTTYDVTRDPVFPEVERDGYTLASWSGPVQLAEDGSWRLTPGTIGNVTLDAVWQANTNAITYVFGCEDYSWAGGSAGASSYETGRSVEIPALTRPGYRFLGWTGVGGIEPTSPKTTYTLPEGSFGDRAYEAHWQEEDYTITYDMSGKPGDKEEDFWSPEDIEGDRIVRIFTVKTGEFMIPDPVRPGYAFDGWTGGPFGATAAKGAQAKVPARYIGSFTLVAHWTPVTPRIRFIYQGTIAGFSQPGTFSVNTPPIVVGTPVYKTPSGEAIFRGWSGGKGDLAACGIEGGLAVPDASGNVTFDVARAAAAIRPQDETQDLVFTAQFQIRPFSVLFDLKSASAGAASGMDISAPEGGADRFKLLTEGYKGLEDASVRSITLPEMSWGVRFKGHMLVGWDTENKTARPGSDLTARWKPGEVISVNDILATGKTANSKGELTLYAIWGDSTQQVVYHPLTTDAAVPPEAVRTFLGEEGISADDAGLKASLMGEGAKAGYRFAGWYASPTYEPESCVIATAADAGAKGRGIPAGTYNTVELFAKWVYDVRYEAGAGVVDISGVSLPKTRTLTWYPSGTWMSAEHLGEAFGEEMAASIEKAAATTASNALSGATSVTARGYGMRQYERTEGDASTSAFAWSTVATPLGDAAARANLIFEGDVLNGRLAPAAATKTSVLFATWEANEYLISLATTPEIDMEGTPSEEQIKLLEDVISSLSEDASEGGWHAQEEGGPLLFQATYGRPWTTPEALPTDASGEFGFVGWSAWTRDESGEPLRLKPDTLFGAATSVAEALVTDERGVYLKAHWIKTDYQTLTLDGAGGQIRSDLPEDAKTSATTFATTKAGTTVTLPNDEGTTSDVFQPFEREGYVFAGWKVTEGDAEHTFSYDTDPATWTVPLRPVTETTEEGELVRASEIRAEAQWTRAVYRIDYLMADEEEESGYRTVSSVDGLTSISDVIPRGQEDLTNNGQSLASWAVDASATSTYLPGQKTTVADLVKAAAAAGEGIPYVRGAEKTPEAKTTGYVLDPAPSSGASDAAYRTSTRVVRLYSQWTMQLTGSVPAVLTMRFDPYASPAAEGGSYGRVDAATGEVRSTTQQPLQIATLKTTWTGLDDYATRTGLRALYPAATWTQLATTELVVEAEGVASAMDVAHGGVVSKITDAQGNEILMEGDEPLETGYVLPAGSAAEPSVLKLLYKVILPTSWIGNPTTTARTLDVARLTYTVRLATPSEPEPEPEPEP